MTETEACIVLNMIAHVGPFRFRKLYHHFGSAVAVLQATGELLRHVEGIGREVAESIRTWEKQVHLDAEVARIEAFGATVLIASDKTYPSLLRDIEDPPIVLYCWGNLEERDLQHGVGIVGTRDASHYGLEATKKLGYQLAYAGLTVYSGLARGIDTIAHQAALAAHGRTIAVLGSGLEEIYPQENIPLAEKIISSGAVITEFPMSTKPSQYSFPKRNRIISGCSFGLLVVEAGLRSGALISANQAMEQGRSIYCVPGRINQPSALGSNKLIQQGAKLVMDAGDILSDFPLLFSHQPQLEHSKPTLSLKEEELMIYESIGEEPTPIDQIIALSSLSPALVSSKLLAMELSGHVRSMPGGRFVKLI
ncbi:MAG: DNA-processing protein DprA [Verrucomicrobiae bacterium]|jgi:DNA processing protein|nr:DNA-processing protein DprA [Verrucomicrobiae bacterium]